MADQRKIVTLHLPLTVPEFVAITTAVTGVFPGAVMGEPVGEQVTIYEKPSEQ